MRVPLAIVCLLVGSDAAAQRDVLHYDFRAGKGQALNQARGAQAGPPSGTFVSTNKSTWTQGKFDSAIKGVDTFDYQKFKGSHNYLDTGWKAGLSGSFTVSWFMKTTSFPPPANGAYYLFGGDDGLRCFGKGRIHKGLAVAGWGGSGYLDLDKDIQSLVQGGWVHIALVVDAGKRLATFYVDGEPERPIRLFAAPVIGARKNGFRIGAWLSVDRTSFWDIDEFRLTARALTDLEVRGLTVEHRKYGSGCGATLDKTGDEEPKIGSTKYSLSLTAEKSAAAVLAIGFSPARLGAIPLPVDLGKLLGNTKLDGCMWQTSTDLVVLGSTDKDGKLEMPFPLPDDAQLIGLTFYNQCLVATSKTVQTSNGYLFSVLPK